MSEKMMVTKVTLSTGKSVLLREPKIKDTDLAAQSAAPRSGGDVNVLQYLAQKEMLKALIVAINDKAVSPKEVEDLDSIFSVKEYSQLLKVASKILGDDELGKEPTIEHVAFGSK